MNSIFQTENQVIIAQCTPHGSGAIALLRLSGFQTRNLVAGMSKLSGEKTVLTVASHTIHYGWIINEQGKHIDQVMFIVMDGPKTFTGETVVEITCHNNPFLIENIILQALRLGARLAQEGEFTRRAFENGKIDLIQAEAINDLIHANTQQGLKKSLAQLEGSFSAWIVDIEAKLLKALAFCEASFEFLDEGHEFGDIVLATTQEILSSLTNLKKTFDIQNQIREGIRVALIGSVNAGKSSIFNALLKQNRAIVTDIAGTTRDALEAGIYKNGSYWTIIDTAGLRSTNDIIEQEGIKKSWQEAEKADVILLVLDNARAATAEEGEFYEDIHKKHSHKVIVVRNKIDQQPQNKLLPYSKSIDVAGALHFNIDQLENTIEKKIESLLQTVDSPFLLNKRQFNNILALEQQLQSLEVLMKTDIQYEIISLYIRQALENLSELTGKTISEKGLDQVFKEFCVGK